MYEPAENRTTETPTSYWYDGDLHLTVRGLKDHAKNITLETKEGSID